MYSDLLLGNTVRWLSRGEVLKRFVICLKKVKIFLNSKGLNYRQLEKAEWLEKLRFIVDMTAHLNSLNTASQGKHSPAHAGRCFGIRVKVHGFCQKFTERYIISLPLFESV